MKGKVSPDELKQHYLGNKKDGPTRNRCRPSTYVGRLVYAHVGSSSRVDGNIIFKYLLKVGIDYARIS